MKGNYGKDYRNPNTSFDSQSMVSNSVSIKKGVNKKNQPVDLREVDRLFAILDLNFKKDQIVRKKLILNISVKGMLREVANIEFDTEVVFKTEKEKQEL